METSKEAKQRRNKAHIVNAEGKPDQVDTYTRANASAHSPFLLTLAALPKLDAIFSG